MTRTDAPELAPFVSAHDGGEARWWFGALAIIRLTGAETGGAMTVIEVAEPPGAEAPLHVHHREDETFILLEGDAVFEVGDTRVEATAGDTLFGPRDVPHRYTVGPRGCRMLFVCTPGGNFEHLVRAMSEPAPARELPPPTGDGPAPEDIEAMVGVIGSFGCELVG